jgi:FkbM family methyltransferase
MTNSNPYSHALIIPAHATTTDERIAMTCSCRDAAHIPKVADAGKILQDDQGRSVQIMHNGLKVVADGYYGSWMTELITRLQGHHEPQEESVFHALINQLPAQATMLEVGSYWSYYSLWFLSQHAAQRRAYAIEPDPEHLKIGRLNCQLNTLDITFENGFICGEESPPQDFQTEKSGVLPLRPISVTGLMQRHGIDRLDLILCDAQGGEIDLLVGLPKLVQAERIGSLMLSTHAYQITGDPLTHQKCIALVEKMGATILLEHDVHESFSGDGLILAHFHGTPPKIDEGIISRNRYSHAYFRNPLYDLAESLAEIQKLRDENTALTDAYEQLKQKKESSCTVKPQTKRGIFSLLKS